MILTTPVDRGAPVTSSRMFTSALSPRGAGGWNFITQSYSTDGRPTEWITVHLETGDVEISEGPVDVYANSNFEVASANTGVATTNQLRAANGRIFFPERYGAGLGTTADLEYANVAYYDPTDEEIHQLAPLHLGVGATYFHSLMIQMVFNHSGSILYAGTQGAIGAWPTIISVDPVTLAQTVVGQVGATPSIQPKYAYYMAKDEAPGADYLYVAVGQLPWEIVSINVNTGVQTVLATLAGAYQFVEFTNRWVGWSVKTWQGADLATAATAEYWIADGALSAYPGSGAPPGGARDVTPYTNALVAPPELDWSRGIGQVLWRPNGSSGPWSQVDYVVEYRDPVVIESMIGQGDARLLGNCASYAGFFRYDPSSEEVTWFGGWPGGVSQPVNIVVDDHVYICGYPNGVLYRYDPAEDWAVLVNPELLGNYTASGVKYPYFLLRSTTNGKLYMTGRRERDAVGSGVGWYDPDTDTFGGHSVDLAEPFPRGWVVLDDVGRVVFSGEVTAGDAELVIYDLDLVELDRHVIQAGVMNTGLLFRTATPNIVMGVIDDEQAAYRYNIDTGVLLQWVELGAAVTAVTQHADGSVWCIVGTTLTRIDVDTLEVHGFSGLNAIAPVSLLAWDGDRLYASVGGDLYTSNFFDGQPFKPVPLEDNVPGNIGLLG